MADDYWYEKDLGDGYKATLVIMKKDANHYMLHMENTQAGKESFMVLTRLELRTMLGEIRQQLRM